jgi:hypothetical protein
VFMPQNVRGSSANTAVKRALGSHCLEAWRSANPLMQRAIRPSPRPGDHLRGVAWGVGADQIARHQIDYPNTQTGAVLH